LTPYKKQCYTWREINNVRHALARINKETLVFGMEDMDPDDIILRNTSQEFEYEKMSRVIDEVNDIKALRRMCKFLMKVEMKTRETYSTIIQDLTTAEYPYSDVLETYDGDVDL